MTRPMPCEVALRSHRLGHRLGVEEGGGWISFRISIGDRGAGARVGVVEGWFGEIGELVCT